MSNRTLEPRNLAGAGSLSQDRGELCSHPPPVWCRRASCPLAAAGSASAIAMASDGQLHALVALHQATNRAQWHDTGGGQTGFAFVEFLALSTLLVVALLSGWGARRRGRGLFRRLGRRCKPRRRSGPPPRALSLLAARACAVGRLSPLRPHHRPVPLRLAPAYAHRPPWVPPRAPYAAPHRLRPCRLQHSWRAPCGPLRAPPPLLTGVLRGDHLHL